MNCKDYKLLEPFYNSTAPRVLIKAGRQIGKSYAIAGKQTLKSSLVGYYNILTAHPLAKQSQKFCKLYIDEIFDESPLLRTRITSSKKNLTNTLTLKKLSNKSELHFTYLGDDASRIRGTSVRDVYWDEIQNIMSETIPIAEQCTSAYPDPNFSYTGTPLTLSNTMELLWRKTTMCEPYITCSRCNHRNFCTLPEVYKMITKKGLVCQKCQILLSMEDIYGATYQIGNPTKKEEFEGFHIPQIFVPNAHKIINGIKKRWNKIFYDFESYNEFEFATEILGISFDTGGKPITLSKLQECCTERNMGKYKPGDYVHKVLGVDWGYATSRSLTVVTVIGIKRDGTIDVLYAKKYRYNDRLGQIDEFVKLYRQFNCSAIAADRGVGITDNAIFRTKVGYECVYEYQYCESKQTLKFNEQEAYYSTSKRITMSLLFTALNKNHITFPKYEEFEDFFNDVLSVCEEVRESPFGIKKFYNRNPEIPDDFIHALNFAIITARLLTLDTVYNSIIKD